MITIVCGGRDNHLSEEDKEYLKTVGITHVVAGGASGIDTDAIKWAKDNNITFTEIKAEWENIDHPKAVIRTRKDGTKYDLTAGFRRNEEMAKIAEACVVFPGRNGTKHMKDTAEKLGLKVFERTKQ